MHKLAIFGASGHGKVVGDTALQCGWSEIAFFDDAWPKLQTNGRWSVLGDTASLRKRAREFSGVVVAIGNNRIRLNKSLHLREAGLALITLIHPRACVSEDVAIDLGSVVFAGAVVQTGTSIGLAGIVNTVATVDHDCSLTAGVHVCPGAHLAGGVAVGECSWIGIGATVNQCMTIGADVTVGAKSAVIADIPDKVTVVGVPAQVIEKRS